MIQNITIPTPCHEKWQKMTPTENGRHCQSCCKTVIDFTVMSNSQILDYLSKSKDACGQISPHQMAAINNGIDTRRRFSWKSLLAAASLIGATITANADEKTYHQMEVGPSNRKLQQEVPIDTTTYVLIKGKVMDNSDNLPVQGATIRLKGTPNGTMTDTLGAFQLKAPVGSTIVITFIGYMPQEIGVFSNQEGKPMTICVEAQPLMLGELVWIKPPFYKRWWYKVKRIF